APRPHRGAWILRAAVRPGVHDSDLGAAAARGVAGGADRDVSFAAVLPGAVRADPREDLVHGAHLGELPDRRRAGDLAAGLPSGFDARLSAEPERLVVRLHP